MFEQIMEKLREINLRIIKLTAKIDAENSGGGNA